jgi:hypothetical protein
MTRPVDILDLDAIVDRMAREGEGQTWTECPLFMTAAEADGIHILWRGFAFRRDRCPAPGGNGGDGAPAD